MSETETESISAESTESLTSENIESQVAAYDPTMAIVCALGVNTAYYKYNNPSWKLSFGSYTIVAEIYVFEVAKAGYVFFGFAATGSYNGQPPYNNIVALRGTQSSEEAVFDLADWSFTPCYLPASSWNAYGNVCTSLYDFYSGTDGVFESLGDSFKKAVQKLPGSRTDWYVCAHSLGASMAMLGSLDAVVSKSYNNTNVRPKIYTYGGLTVGDQSFVNALQANGITEIYRLVNLADWVPAFHGATADAAGYVQPGLECNFLWQTGGFWGNHSLTDVYLNTLKNYSNVIKFGPRKYPQ